VIPVVKECASLMAYSHGSRTPVAVMDEKKLVPIKDIGDMTQVKKDLVEVKSHLDEFARFLLMLPALPFV
jgi:hypothetical protein